MPIEDDYEDQPEYSTRSRRSRQGGRPPSLRSIVAAVAWLEGRPRWSDGQVTWLKNGSGEVCAGWRPARADLVRSERALGRLNYRLQRQPDALVRALDTLAPGSGEAKEAGITVAECGDWIGLLGVNLQASKRLTALAAPDLLVLAKPSRVHNPKHAERLAELLQAEAMCINALPASPARALKAYGSLARKPLRKLVADWEAPQTARALAALVLGDIDAKYPTGQVARTHGRGDITTLITADEWLARCYRWGQHQGIPGQGQDEPALLVELLETKEGARSASTCLNALQSMEGNDEIFTVALLREWLAGGVAPAEFPGLLASVAPLCDIFERLQRRPAELPENPYRSRGNARKCPDLRRSVAHDYRMPRQQLVAELKRQLHAYWRATPDCDIPAMLTTHARAILVEADWQPSVAEAILHPLRLGHKLPTKLHKPWLELVVRCHKDLWDMGDTFRSKVLSNRLEFCRRSRVVPTHAILLKTGDVTLAGELLELRAAEMVAGEKWQDPAICYWLCDLTREFSLYKEPWTYREVCGVFARFPNLARARATLGPLVAALVSHPQPVRNETLAALLTHVPKRDTHLFRDIVPFVPSIVAYAAHGQGKIPDTAVCALVQMLKQATSSGNSESDSDQSEPNGLQNEPNGLVQRRFRWLLDHLLTEEVGDKVLPQSHRLEELIDVAWIIGKFDGIGDRPPGGQAADGPRPVAADAFVRHLRLALRQNNLPYYNSLEKGLAVLDKHPLAGAGLGVLFERQPQRCLRVIDEMGTATRMGAGSLLPLQLLEATGDEIAATQEHAPEWERLVQQAPPIAKPALLYQFARRVRGESAGVPPALQRQLSISDRLQRELKHLERLRASGRADNGIAKRIGNLQSRLADAGILEAGAASQANEKLLAMAGEELVATTEYLLQQCYRQRLKELVGPLPADLEWNADFTNAILMSFDIDSNRPLLRRLLRDYIGGERRWPLDHPANDAFLQELKDRGVEAKAWTGTFPRRYVNTRARGGYVSLHLETDPLRILQMGNHFGTCLSRGGGNSFSTVTNAAEANKRVVYATDGTGHVVGRQLLGINEAGELVGFHVYTSLTNEAENNALRRCFRRYVESFAAACGLKLGNEGDVPKLFAGRWYNDGIINWDEEESEVRGKSPAGGELAPEIKLHPEP